MFFINNHTIVMRISNTAFEQSHNAMTTGNNLCFIDYQVASVSVVFKVIQCAAFHNPKAKELRAMVCLSI